MSKHKLTPEAIAIALEKPLMPGREYDPITQKWEWIGGVKRDLWAEAQREIMEKTMEGEYIDQNEKTYRVVGPRIELDNTELLMWLCDEKEKETQLDNS